MTEPVILVILAAFAFMVVTFVVLLRFDERITRLEALIKCLESENIALRRKVNGIVNDPVHNSDNDNSNTDSRDSDEKRG